MEMGDIYGLLRYLGLSAESTRFFYVSYAVYLTTRQPARTPFAEWWLYPAVAGHYHTCIFNVKRSVCVAVDRVWETERETITDKREIDNLFANLSTVHIKSGESYNDSPMTDKFIKIFFEVSDGLSGCAVYIFEDENGFFVEQPYNGIFSIEGNQYTEILGLLF